MGVKKQYPMSIDMRDIPKVDGDLALAFWYSILKDYAKRMKKDKDGFIRVSSKVFEFDYGVNRMKIWRYNKRLEDKGLVSVDRAARGGRTWIGFKLT